jgi:hypothetical protein
MPSRVFYGNEHYYVFFRLHQYLYDRCIVVLQSIKYTTCIMTAIYCSDCDRQAMQGLTAISPTTQVTRRAHMQP